MKLVIPLSVLSGALAGVISASPTATADGVSNPIVDYTSTRTSVLLKSAGEWSFEPVSVEVEEPVAPTPVLTTTQDSTPVTAQPRAQAPVEPVATSSGVLDTAMRYIGSPYVWGGVTPSGWDCIGFVRYVYAQHGVKINYYTHSVLEVGVQVPYSEVLPGDILYWPGHVAISVGNGKNVAAWNESMGTQVGSDMWSGAIPTVIRVGS